MTRKNANPSRSEPTVVERGLPASFTFRPNEAFNVRVREYLLRHAISFNELCEAALIDYLARNPFWQRKHLRLPRGKRPRNP